MRFVFWLFSLVVLMSALGCAENNPPLTTEQLNRAELVKNILRSYNLSILHDLTGPAKIVAATLTSGEDKVHDDHGHTRLIIAFPGTPDKNGEYGQPTRNLGGKMYVFETLYTAYLEQDEIILEKSVAEIGKYGRSPVAVEPQMLLDIAKALNGTVIDNKVTLP